MGQIHNGDASKPIANAALADSQHIVRCVNAHDRLVHIVERLLLAADGSLSGSDTERTFDNARALLASLDKGE
jgi:hypothetical protein